MLSQFCSRDSQNSTQKYFHLLVWKNVLIRLSHVFWIVQLFMELAQNWEKSLNSIEVWHIRFWRSLRKSVCTDHRLWSNISDDAFDFHAFPEINKFLTNQRKISNENSKSRITNNLWQRNTSKNVPVCKPPRIVE